LEIYSIGFTRRSAESFFEALRRAGIRVLMDVRLRNTSQLSGFAKRDDLAYFLRHLVNTDYVQEPSLAPTEELLRAYRSRQVSWDEFEVMFRSLMEERRIEEMFNRSLFDRRVCLLCSEFEPTRCHRRLVLDYLNDRWGGVEAIHL
jgi:uncharacterized protein (DUF488 family)